MEKERKGRDRIRLLVLLLLVAAFVLISIGKNGLSTGLTLAAVLGYVLSLIVLLLAAIPAAAWKRPDLMKGALIPAGYLALYVAAWSLGATIELTWELSVMGLAPGLLSWGRCCCPWAEVTAARRRRSPTSC